MAQALGAVETKIGRFVDRHEGDMRLPRTPGTLTLFLAENAMHRVTEVNGQRPRISADYSYDVVPDRYAAYDANVTVYGPRLAELFARRRTG